MGVLNDNMRHGASAAGTYEIDRSLRFNGADNAYLSFTPGSAGNQTTWTYSVWVKRSAITAADYDIFGNNANYNDYLFFNATTDNFEYYVSNAGGYSGPHNTNAVYRDTSAWYHIVWTRDTNNSTDADRSRIYVNGVRQTMSAQPSISSGFEGHINAASEHRIGNLQDSFDYEGYMTEINFIDGQALDASSFGKTDSITGAWVPKKYAGSYGSQGYYLNFSDNSNTTAATLGKDSSGNGNNWTPNNFSVAAGEGNDSVTDTPTNNYCTWNPLDWIWGGFDGHQADDRLRNGALSTSGGDGKNAFLKGSFYVSSGKWYYECKGVGHGGDKIGWARSEDVNGSEGSGSDHTTHHAYLSGNGQFQSHSPGGTHGGTTYGGSIADGDVIGCAIDMDSNTVAWHNGGQWGDGSGNWDETYDNANKISISNDNWSPGYLDSSHTGGGDIHANFGQQGFAHTPPTGFQALCTANMPEPTIKDPSKHFGSIAYTGDEAASRTISDTDAVGFTPDLVWVKNLDSTAWNILSDSVRGHNGKTLYSNRTEAEYDASGSGEHGHVSSSVNGGFVATDSDGTVGVNLNNSGDTYGSWFWKAGDSTTNGDGSISATVRANPSAGFSIVQYDVPAAAGNFTVGHGLGAAPHLILAKNLDTDSNWDVFSKDIPNTHRLKLNSDAAIEDQPAWGDTSPTSSVFTSLGGGSWHGAGGTMINYCFTSVEGYSKIDIYIPQGGTGAHGEFVWTGFRPGFVMIKRKDASGPWNVFDSAREPYNLVHKNIRWNTDGGDDTGRDIDFLSNGFKVRDSGTEINDNDDVYIYMAIAETSFKYANAR